MEVLAENGYIDLAYDVVTQTTYPSWGYMVENGATTTWERWEYVDSGPMLDMASHCHPMNATVSAWFYRYLLGIQPIKPGFAEFQIAPCVPTKLGEVKGSLQTIKGNIETAWKKADNTLCLTVSVPFNTKCKVVTPDGWSWESAGREQWLFPGMHKLSFQFGKV
jgi:alpha-L-rhamnosidase